VIRTQFALFGSLHLLLKIEFQVPRNLDVYSHESIKITKQSIKEDYTDLYKYLELTVRAELTYSNTPLQQQRRQTGSGAHARQHASQRQ
jgi:hypothetical protein